MAMWLWTLIEAWQRREADEDVALQKSARVARRVPAIFNHWRRHLRRGVLRKEGVEELRDVLEGAAHRLVLVDLAHALILFF